MTAPLSFELCLPGELPVGDAEKSPWIDNQLNLWKGETIKIIEKTETKKALFHVSTHVLERKKIEIEMHKNLCVLDSSLNLFECTDMLFFVRQLDFASFITLATSFIFMLLVCLI